MFVGPVVAFDNYFIDGSLGPFKNTQFKIDGIVFYRYFGRIYIEEKVTIVHVQGTDVAAILAETQAIFE